jgi:cephalosporin-C deacetylase-like acetyl esterase
MKKVSFTVAGQKIVGTLQFPEQIKEKNPAILIIHGWNSAQIRFFF